MKLPNSLIFLFFIALALSQSYDQSKARALAYYSKIAYKSKDQITKWNCKQCSEYSLTDVSYFQEEKKNIHAFIGFSSALKGIVVSFRGTDPKSITNIITDINYLDVEYPNCKDCKVHKGIYKAFIQTQDDLQPLLASITKKYPLAKVYFTGHSLGGGIAAFAAAEYFNDYNLGQVYTYGKPRIGNKKFAQWFDSNIQAFRVVHFNDPVPRLPPRSLKSLVSSHYSAIQRHELNKQLQLHQNLFNFEYFHEGKEAWYLTGMKDYTFCQTEAKQCSYGRSKLAVSDHSSDNYILIPKSRAQSHFKSVHLANKHTHLNHQNDLKN